MDGTITFSAPVATEPNFFFGWYSSEHTGHRIGLGVSNSVETGFVAEDNFLRVDLGYGSTPSKFYWTSGDGTLNQANHNSVLPNGTYPFTFDYQPGPDENPGGTMSATVGDYHFSISPLDSQPWITDFFSLDRFGILQRTTGQTSNNPVGPWNVTFSNVTYTGGTPVAGGAIGDFDGNGQVDAADLTILTGNYGNAGTSATGDADGNLVVDGNDFLIWQRNAVTGGAASAVPEPGALALLAIGGLAGLLRRRSV
jgi:hypothetical protein